MTLSVAPIPMLLDNYAYALIDERKRAVLIDPSDATVALAFVREHHLSVEAIWCTHHHPDHVGGVAPLCDALGVREVLGSAYDLHHARIPRQTRGLLGGDVVEFAARRARVLHVPGHTLGAIAYCVDDLAFTGDVLFVGGCGRVFEGTMPMMRASLDALAALPDGTRIYPGHEYAESNLRFGQRIEPGSLAIPERLADVQAARARGEPYVGRTIDDERATNVFLRSRAPEVIDAARGLGASSSDPDAVFEAVRRKKGHG